MAYTIGVLSAPSIRAKLIEDRAALVPGKLTQMAPILRDKASEAPGNSSGYGAAALIAVVVVGWFALRRR